jgi:cyanuric acid amidohydrolase
MPVAKVHRISAASPDDVSGIEAAIAAGRIDPAGIRAIFGKTEGNGCVNDFSRGFAVKSLELMLRVKAPVAPASSCPAARKVRWRRTGSCSSVGRS